MLDGWPATRFNFKLLALTAARSGEERLATHEEIDEAANFRIVPPERMKARGTHIVPLCPRALRSSPRRAGSSPDPSYCFPAP